MALYSVETVLTYVAWDTQTNAGKVDDAANHTLYWVKDGTANAATNAPSQVDATNAPGLYKVTITSTEAQCIFGTLCGKSSTANISIIPVSLAFERLPNAAIGGEGGLPILDANGHLPVNVKRISDDPDAADNLELAYDGTGYAGGTVKQQVDLVSILGTVLTETAGQIAAAFKTFFNVATPTGTVNSIPSVTGAVGSVTGAVGSVAGDVAGKVLGGGSGTITGIGAWALGSAGAALATAATFTGITALANWLRAIIRSDTADATALSEINATGGTYDETTDSLQGIATTQVEELAADAAIAADTAAKLDTALEADGAVYRWTANALEEAPSGSVVGGTIIGITARGYTLSADQVDLEVYRGDDVSIEFQIYSDAAQTTAYDLTGATLTWTAKLREHIGGADDTTAVIQKTMTLDADPTTGQATVTLDGQDTEDLETDLAMEWDICIVESDGDIRTGGRGTITVRTNITRTPRIPA